MDERPGVWVKQALYSLLVQFCKNDAVDGVSDLAFSINYANKDLVYFLEMVKDLGKTQDTHIIKHVNFLVVVIKIRK